MMPASVSVAGLRLIPVGVEAARDMVLADAHAPNPRVYVLVNAYSATLRRQNPDYASALESPSVRGLPDGAPVAWGARRAGAGTTIRCPGPDLLEACVRMAASDGTPMFLLGGDSGVAEELAVRLQEIAPGLQIAGTATPPYGTWSAEDSEALCLRVRESGAKVLWLGVSAPKQETWAVANLDSLGIPVVCVGAAFDFYSGRKPRAPKWMRSAGLEWLFRLLSEPGRTWRRYLIGNAVFIWDLLRLGSHSLPQEEWRRHV